MLSQCDGQLNVAIGRQDVANIEKATPLQNIQSIDYDLEWFEVTLKNGNRFAHVPAAAIDSARRLKLLISEMTSAS